jgi:hypothetical protein
MHSLLHILAVGTSTTTKTSKKSSSSTYTLLFIVVIFGAVYFLFLRPRQQKMHRADVSAPSRERSDRRPAHRRRRAADG